MKKNIFLLFLLFGIFFLSSCSDIEKELDSLYSEKEDIELSLADAALSEKEIERLSALLDNIESKITVKQAHFSVDISGKSFNINDIPYSSDNVKNIGEWFFSNLIYPLYCYESDYQPLYINSEENFTSQEKFYIISYHLLREFDSLLAEKYSYFTVSASTISEISVKLFGEDIDRASVRQYSAETDSYAIPIPENSSHLLTPVLGNVKIKDVSKTEISVNYAEQTLSRSIYSEVFLFERTENGGFSLCSRVRKNQSVSLVSSKYSDISDSEVMVLDFSAIKPQNIAASNKKELGELLLSNYADMLDNYIGEIYSYEDLSVSSILNMSLLLQPNIDELIAEAVDNYSYFGVPVDFIEQQATSLFGSVLVDYKNSEYYNKSLDLLVYRISDITQNSYRKQVLDVRELDGDMVRLETALFEPDNFFDLIAKEVVIFKSDGNGIYSVVSRHYNMNVSSYFNSYYADIVPVYPDVYPDTSSSNTTKGIWLYENYGSLINFEFSSYQKISSERLALFAVERLMSSEDFAMLKVSYDCFAFPKVLVEEQIRLFFGNTGFKSEYVSFYDIDEECFFVDYRNVSKKETSGTVISAGSSENNVFYVYIELPASEENDYGSVQYALNFYELENKTYRFISAHTVER